jgi:hypothetical protein
MELTQGLRRPKRTSLFALLRRRRYKEENSVIACCQVGSAALELKSFDFNPQILSCKRNAEASGVPFAAAHGNRTARSDMPWTSNNSGVSFVRKPMATVKRL